MPAVPPWKPGTSLPPGLTWKPPPKPRSRSDTRPTSCRRAWVTCCARRETSDGARSTFEAALRSARRNGSNIGMAWAVLGLACLAGDAGDWDRAAALHGVAQAFLDRTGNPWQEVPARARRDSLDQARAHLGDEQLERVYATGMALSLEKALELALPRADPA